MKTSELTTKQLQRLERKKKKISAYLTIAKLNDQDRYDRQIKLMQKSESQKEEDEEEEDQVEKNNDQKDCDELLHSNECQLREGPCRKKLKKDEVNVEESNGMFSNVADVESNSFMKISEGKKEDDQCNINLGHYNCAENSYLNYYVSPLEVTQHYHEIGDFQPLNISSESNRSHVQYQSYEVRGHHNSETYYFKTGENPLVPADALPDGKLSCFLENWNGLIFSKKNRSDAVGSSGKPLLHGESYEELKRQLRERKNYLKAIPRIVLKESGERASYETEEAERVPLFVSDIQDLLVYSQGEHTFYKPRWCNLEKPNRITKTIVLIVEGITAEDFLAKESTLSAFNDGKFSKLETLMPNAYQGNLVEELASVPLCPAAQKELLKKYRTVDNILSNNRHIRYRVIRALFPIVRQDLSKMDPNLPEGDKFSRTELLLSAWQLLEENYPVPLTGPLKHKYKDYVLTKEYYSEVTPHSPMFAVDCEMCKTEGGELELTRISIVNENLEVIYDTLVKPSKKIIDYLTRFSGITKKMMDPVTTSLVDVQTKIREILPQDAILIGQSLNCDLHALKMMHPYVIDTSVIFNITGVKSKKTKLVILSREFLSEKIQSSSRGHCSAEDSAACMKLVKLKLANSIEFGDATQMGQSSESNVQQVDQNETNGEVVHVVSGEKLTISLLQQVGNYGKKGVVLGSEDVVSEYMEGRKGKFEQYWLNIVKGLVVDSSREAIEKACQVADENDFVLTHVHSDADSLEKSLKKLNRWTKKMLASTPVNGLCVVLIGNGESSSKGICFTHINRLGFASGPTV